MNWEKLINFKKLKIYENKLNEKQKSYAHLMDPRFFKNNINKYRMKNKSLIYNTSLKLDETLFYLHPFFDPKVLKMGNVKRFPSNVNYDYISEKYFEDKWVSEGNNELSFEIERYIKKNYIKLNRMKKIKILDIGPCGGAITTLFALRAFNKYNLLDKLEIYMLDVVPDVLNVNLNGKFIIPKKLIEEYDLNFVGPNTTKYKQILNSGILINSNKINYIKNDHYKVKYFCGDGEKLPKDIKNIDFIITAYLHHHMNFIGRKNICSQMKKAAKKGAFIGIVDFYVKTFKKYNSWYVPHFKKNNCSPPIEFPLASPKILIKLLGKIKSIKINTKLKNSFLIVGIKP